MYLLVYFKCEVTFKIKQVSETKRQLFDKLTVKTDDTKQKFKIVKNSSGHARRMTISINFYVTLLQK